MPISDTEKQRLRAEEHFRAEVRRELEAAKPMPSRLARVAAFFDSKVGFWLLTTVLAGATATGFTALQRYLDRAEIAERTKIERARADTEMLLKLGPMLTSKERSELNLAIALLESLATNKAVDSVIAAQVKALFEVTIEAGTSHAATPAQQMQAEAILTHLDRARVNALQRPEVQLGAVEVRQDTVDAALPIRVYIQISDETDRDIARRTQTALRDAGLVAPGIESVPPKSSPARIGVRYCEGRIAVGAVEQVQQAVTASVGSAPELVVLHPRLCTKVRHNHFELWFARKAQ